ncbi:MAG: ester cyclase [Burkholderiaceae bacterium]
MKKLLSVILLSTMLFACNNQSANNNDAAKKEQLENDNVKFYDHVWDVVINKGNVNFLDTAYTADVVLHTVPEIKGKDSAKAYYANYVTGFSNREFIVKEIFAKGDRVVKYWQFKGTHTGPFFGIPATGKTVDVIGCTIAKVVDGKITEEQDFFDNYEFLKQIGIVK